VGGGGGGGGGKQKKQGGAERNIEQTGIDSKWHLDLSCQLSARVQTPRGRGTRLQARKFY
jgi:hypothetical protein